MRNWNTNYNAGVRCLNKWQYEAGQNNVENPNVLIQ